MASVSLAQNNEGKATAADSNAVTQTESAVKVMIEKLASVRFADRQQASKDLLNAGPEAEQFIKENRGNADNVGKTECSEQ